MLPDQDIILSEKLQSSALSVTLMDEKTRYSLRIKSKDLAAFKNASGLNLPRKIGTTSRTSTQSLLCLGPDEWMVISDIKTGIITHDILKQMASKFIYSHTDISHRNIAFSLSGPEAANAVNIGCPLDLSLSAFPIGKVTRTVFENAPIMLLRTGSTEFHLECWRSFAPYICGFFDRYETDINAYIDK
jgi:sarcosine oxidase subunit gamma